MTDKKVIVEDVDSVRIVTINRSQMRNCVDRDVADSLVVAFEEFDSDDKLKVAILTGAGGNFCAGADLKAISSGNGNKVTLDGYAPLGISRIRLTKPTIAAVEGYAVAGGLELSLWCDLRVASETAIFGVFCRRFGVPLVDLGTIRLPRLIGHSRAMDMILTGREVAAKEALEFGLANRICGRGKALEVALELANKLCEFPQVCMRSDRLSAMEQWDLTESVATKNEVKRGLEVIMSGETVNGAKYFLTGKGKHGSFDS